MASTTVISEAVVEHVHRYYMTSGFQVNINFTSEMYSQKTATYTTCGNHIGVVHSFCIVTHCKTS